MWVPGHVGIIGNDFADNLAKTAASSQQQTADNKLSADDFKYMIFTQMKVNRNNEWLSISITNKLRVIKNFANKWPETHQLDRKDSVVLARVRIGHTFVTHSHLMSRDPVPQCLNCNEQLTIQHVIETCPQYAQQRLLHNITTIKQSSGNDESGNLNLINYLKEIELYNKI